VPLYDEVARIPLMIRAPGVEPRRVDTFAQPPDLMPTILELAGIEVPETVQGTSLAPVLRGEKEQVRSLAVTSSSIIYGVGARRFTTITDGEWTLIYPGARFDPGQAAVTAIVDSIRRIEKATYRGAGGPELYHLPSDPGQTKNVLAEHPDVAARLHEEHVRVLEELGTPEEYLENRRVLVTEQSE